MMLKISDFDYNLPRQLIAQYPSQKRDESRLLVLHRDTGKIEHRIFKDIIEYFRRDDLLILNNTRVVPARLVGRKETGGKVEALILDARGSRLEARSEAQKDEHEVLLRPARGCKLGSRLIFGEGELKAEITNIENGRRFLKFECNGNFEELLDRCGQMPLPPYIKREPVGSDRERYQTVYASEKGAVAAPTAGLHFTKDILSRVSERGLAIEYITLHVGYGTFRPVRCEDITRHRMEKEYFEIRQGVATKLKNTKKRIIAVGTTTCRVLETIVSSLACPERPFDKLRVVPSTVEGRSRGKPRASSFDMSIEHRICSGWTDLFIYPPYKFKVVDALLTNFHLPRTTLFMLVSAFCRRKLLLRAYEEAIKRKYRFYSYGDAMLIL